MILKRNQLKSIYDGLENTEKRQWASNSNYSGYQGLYKYLRDGGDEVASDKTIQGLKLTVGQERFKALTDVMVRINNQEMIESNSSDISMLEEDTEKIKISTLSSINNISDVDKLKTIEETLEKVTELIKNQIRRIELTNEIRNTNN